MAESETNLTDEEIVRLYEEREDVESREDKAAREAGAVNRGVIATTTVAPEDRD